MKRRLEKKEICGTKKNFRDGKYLFFIFRKDISEGVCHPSYVFFACNRNVFHKYVEDMTLQLSLSEFDFFTPCRIFYLWGYVYVNYFVF